MHGADDVPKAKPAPDGLILCSEELEILPVNSIYIGDSPSDGAAAKAAGMRSIGVTWGSHPVERVAPAFDVTVSSVDELRVELDLFVDEISGGNENLKNENNNVGIYQRMLDKGLPEFGEDNYWSDAYNSDNDSSVDSEWIFSFANVKEVFARVVKYINARKSQQDLNLEEDDAKQESFCILHLGNGHSSLSDDLEKKYGSKYNCKQTVTDISKNCIKFLKERSAGYHIDNIDICPNSNSKITFVQADASDLQDKYWFPSNSYDIVVEKCLYDAIGCADDCMLLFFKIICETHRVLKKERGTFVCMSMHGHLERYLRLKCFGWNVVVHKLDDYDDSVTAGDKLKLPEESTNDNKKPRKNYHFCYVCTMEGDRSVNAMEEFHDGILKEIMLDPGEDLAREWCEPTDDD